MIQRWAMRGVKKRAEVLHELGFTQGLLQPVRADFTSPERSQRWLFGSPFGVGASFFPIERHPPPSQVKKMPNHSESRRTSATKGLLVLPGLGGGEGASALSVIQLVRFQEGIGSVQ